MQSHARTLRHKIVFSVAGKYNIRPYFLKNIPQLEKSGKEIADSSVLFFLGRNIGQDTGNTRF